MVCGLSKTTTARTPARPATTSNKTALLVFLENGGVAANLAVLKVQRCSDCVKATAVGRAVAKDSGPHETSPVGDGDEDRASHIRYVGLKDAVLHDGRRTLGGEEAATGVGRVRGEA